ncbi:hypothetical protein J6590_063952 [Homalodisca vitripennis]|nr:hypothetical protein J6590_063952 [Homalodisca vitripennis]
MCSVPPPDCHDCRWAQSTPGQAPALGNDPNLEHRFGLMRSPVIENLKHTSVKVRFYKHSNSTATFVKKVISEQNISSQSHRHKKLTDLTMILKQFGDQKLFRTHQCDRSNIWNIYLPLGSLVTRNILALKVREYWLGEYCQKYSAKYSAVPCKLRQDNTAKNNDVINTEKPFKCKQTNIQLEH